MKGEDVSARLAKERYVKTGRYHGYYIDEGKWFNLRLVEVQKVLNPGGFDYKRFRNGVKCVIDFDISAILHNLRSVEHTIAGAGQQGYARVEVSLSFDTIILGGLVSGLKNQSSFKASRVNHENIDQFVYGRAYGFDVLDDGYMSIKVKGGKLIEFYHGKNKIKIAKFAEIYSTADGPVVRTITCSNINMLKGAKLREILNVRRILNAFIDMITRIPNRSGDSWLTDVAGNEYLVKEKVWQADNHFMTEPLLDAGFIEKLGVQKAYESHRSFVDENRESLEWFVDAVNEKHDPNSAFLNAAKAAENILSRKRNLIFEDNNTKSLSEHFIGTNKNPGFSFSQMIGLMLEYLKDWEKAFSADQRMIADARNMIAHPKAEESKSLRGMQILSSVGSYGLILMGFYQVVYLVSIGLSKSDAVKKVSRCTFFYMPYEHLKPAPSQDT